MLAEYDENGTLTTNYTRADELISQERSGAKSYYLYDGSDSVRMLANEDGEITDTYTFDAFGNLTASTGSTKNDFLYRGEQFDSFTGLYYLRARYMNPATGTFITMDEYAGSVFEPVSLHKYLYANANPVMYSDSSGHSAALIAGMAGYSIIAKSEQQYNYNIINQGHKYIELAKSLVVLSVMSVVSNELFKLSVDIAAGISIDSYSVISNILEKYATAIVLAQTYAETVKEFVKKNEKPLNKNEQYDSVCVYVLKEKDKVMYVGITNDPARRAAEHANKKKDSNGNPWKMFIVMEGLSRKDARMMEQVLICAYTIEALENARYEIAKKNYKNFDKEMERVSSLLKLPGKKELEEIINKRGN